LAFGIVLASAMLLGGCSGSGDSTSGMFGPDGQPVEADVTSAMQSIVLPMVGGTAELGLAPSAAAAAPDEAEHCADFSDFCFNDGGAEICTNTPDADVLWTYLDCERGHGTIDGTVAFVGSLLEGTTSFALGIGELSLAGDVGWRIESLQCASRSYSDFSAVAPDHSTSIDGEVEYCHGSPSGHLVLEVVKPSASFLLVLDFDEETGTATVTGEEGTFHCTIAMGSGEASCEES
jgi:hypothetical protein